MAHVSLTPAPLVEGRLTIRKYANKDGEKHKCNVVASDIRFVGGGKNGGPATAAAPAES